MIFCVLLLAFSCLQFTTADDVCPDHNIKISEVILDSPIALKPIWVGPDYTNVFIVTTGHTLWRSTDEGRTWSTLVLPGQNETTGIRKVEVAPNGTHVFAYGYGTQLWHSSDSGSTFTQLTPPGYMDYFKYHPSQPWILALKISCPAPDCSNDLYITKDYGTTWNLMTRYVWSYDWHGVKDDENMFIVWERTTKTGRQDFPPYDNRIVKSKNFMATEPTVIETQVFGYLVLEDHLFIAVQSKSGFDLKASRDHGETFYDVDFPGNLPEKQYILLDVSEGSTFIHVRHDRYANYGNVYASNAVDNEFSLSLSNNPLYFYGGLCDFGRFRGIEGIYLGNQYQSFPSGLPATESKTFISYDKGGEWSLLPTPSNVACNYSDPKDCHLNLVGPTMEGSWYTKEQAVGIILGTGNVGPYLTASVPSSLGVYISRDAGWSWKYITSGRHIYEIANRGAILMMAPDDVPTSVMSYSLDEGLNWNMCNFSSEGSLDIRDIEVDPKLRHSIFLLYGTRSNRGVLVIADFSQVQERECIGHENPDSPDSDYETWEPSDARDDECLLGRRVKYTRRKQSAKCFNPLNINISQATFVKNCPCTYEDYECDYCFVRSGDQCVVDTEECPNFDPITRVPAVCNDYYFYSQGYRLVPGDTCDISLGIDLRSIKRPCPTTTSSSSTTSSTPTTTGGSIVDETNTAFSPGILLGMLAGLFVILAGLFATWWASGRNMAVREFLKRFVNESVLPQVDQSVKYSTLAQNEQLDDVEADAPVIDLENDATGFDPRN
eukprot:TRINITY_DN9560_c0_g1_i2.p1 TRINITY_DN9560_c0_g1~~TRINITY_DN9560_c0_g1_i2.p1  ORF type:complete len:776 (-),score=189.67 TRINITY_DN9560_c0_g1_i2:226-2553(-)